MTAVAPGWLKIYRESVQVAIVYSVDEDTRFAKQIMPHCDTVIYTIGATAANDIGLSGVKIVTVSARARCEAAW